MSEKACIQTTNYIVYTAAGSSETEGDHSYGITVGSIEGNKKNRTGGPADVLLVVLKIRGC
jgi:hypothetical protein